MIFYVVDTNQTSLNNIKKCIHTLYPNETVLLQTNPHAVSKEVACIKPDYYISDAILNTTDGIALAEKIKLNNAQIQIAIMSNSKEYAVQAFRIHAKSYLIKPITTEKIKKYLYFDSY